MGRKTDIEYCDATWSPVTGCSHGCEYCYARRIANRFKVPGVTFAENVYGISLKEPIRNPKNRAEPYPFGFLPTFHKYRLDIPGKWKQPKNIFVCSMADLFGEWVPDEWITQVFDACVEPHRYLFLTKNPGRYIELAEKGILPREDRMWYGSTVTSEDSTLLYVENAEEINAFISIEPLLGDFPVKDFGGLGIKWAIIGAETGNRKDKVVPKKEWIDHILETCDDAGIPVFMKDSLIPIVGEGGMRREFPW